MALHPATGVTSTFLPTVEHLPICSFCDRPVNLEVAKTDENGQAIHEECYVVKVMFSDAA